MEEVVEDEDDALTGQMIDAGTGVVLDVCALCLLKEVEILSIIARLLLESCPVDSEIMVAKVELKLAGRVQFLGDGLMRKEISGDISTSKDTLG